MVGLPGIPNTQAPPSAIGQLTLSLYLPVIVPSVTCTKSQLILAVVSVYACHSRFHSGIMPCDLNFPIDLEKKKWALVCSTSCCENKSDNFQKFFMYYRWNRKSDLAPTCIKWDSTLMVKKKKKKKVKYFKPNQVVIQWQKYSNKWNFELFFKLSSSGFLFEFVGVLHYH